MIYIGIDPGASGGIAVLGGAEPVTWKAPETERDLWDLINSLGDKAGYAVIEKVWGHIGGPGQPGSAMFKFGQSYGSLRMALVAAEIPFEEATPQRWMKGLGIPSRSKKESKTQWKNRLKARAQQLFPGTSITLATADALLIAEFCRRSRNWRLTCP